LAAVEAEHPPEVDGRAVGRRIARARYEAGWMTQKTLAELLCVCKRSVQAYEAGRTIPYRHLQRLGQIFERPSSWFLYGDGPTDDGASVADRDDELVRFCARPKPTRSIRQSRRTVAAVELRVMPRQVSTGPARSQRLHSPSAPEPEGRRREQGPTQGGEMANQLEKYRTLSRDELEALAGEPLPDRAAMSLINANVAAPINAAIALNALSDNSLAYANATQDATITQSN
jgi:transcriptional regulator with XRE-family HTH domain